jgi:molecular chaperone DnaJ
VPAGTQTGTVFRLKGKGLPRLGQTSKGDLNVRVHVWTPETLTEEQMRLLHELAQHEGAPPKREDGFWARIREALGA